MIYIKGIYEKEKTELLFKNSTLQNNLDRLKLNLSEQVHFYSFLD
jgi:hypothetical protein